jgi:serine/threonine-protein kinase HipA
MFHAEGALADEKIRAFWLVKFPRGRRSEARNEQILRNEAPYLEVARLFGIRTGDPLRYEQGALFVPRFDRQVADGRVERMGMHSLYAVAGLAGYGAAVSNDTFCRALAAVATDPARELQEYIRRDILNLALRNTDNHGRNSAVLRSGDQIALSPLFDFAPMFLDPEGIGRVSRWEDEPPGRQPDWRAVVAKFEDIFPSAISMKWLAGIGAKVRHLPATMRDCRVDEDIIERLSRWIAEVAAGLIDAGRPV